MSQLAESVALAEALVGELFGDSCTKSFDEAWRDLHSPHAGNSEECREVFALACLQKHLQQTNEQAAEAELCAYLDLGLWLGGPDSICSPFLNTAISALAKPSVSDEGALLPGLSTEVHPSEENIVSTPPSKPTQPCTWRFPPPIRWSKRQFWESYAHRYVSIECVKDGSVQRWLPMMDFLSLLVQDGCEHDCTQASWWFSNGRMTQDPPAHNHTNPSLPYLAQAPLCDLWPALTHDMPELPDWAHHASPLVFFGPVGVTTDVHKDPTDNVFHQCVGAKQALLWSPDAFHPKLSADPERAHFVDPSQTERENPSMRFVLHPGQCLFIPKGWWHYFKAETTSISVAYMF